MLSSNTLRMERVKTKIRSSSVSNDEGADPTQILPPKRGLKLASLNTNKVDNSHRRAYGTFSK